MSTAPPRRLGVVGAGTMGAGIAQLGCLAGMETLLHDPFPEALERGAGSVRRNLERGAERERWSADDALAAEGRLRPCGSLEDLAPCELVVEAAPERLELKRELFAQLAEACGEQAVLASNTSSILIAALAGGAPRPEQVVGMHFFNPAPLMPLVEVIPSLRTGERAVAVARAAAEAMGKRVIVAADGPGFLVNRCGRPFNGESIRLLEERVASHEQIDRIARLGGGFRMGPFELMDLVGIDVGFEVAQSFQAQSFGEPRWRPTQTQARMTAAGLHGRKTGRGYYDYADGSGRPADPAPPAAGGGEGRAVVVAGAGAVAKGVRARARAAGFEVRAPDALAGAAPELVIDAAVPAPVADLAGSELGSGDGGPPVATLCADASLAERGEPGACGFHVLAPVEAAQLVELTRLPATPPAAAEAAERFFGACGFVCEWVEDAPGLVLGRIVCQLVNEGLFAVGEGVGSPEEVDLGTTLGLSHPRGPVEWGRLIGFDHVLATVDGLWRERREERYRAAPLLRRLAATGAAL